MTTGVRVSNSKNQVMISNEDICFGLSQKLTATTASIKNWGKCSGNVQATGCISPLIVYELGDVVTRIQASGGTSNTSGFNFIFFSTTPSIPANVYVFDVASVAKLDGMSVLRMYRADGELAFDNRIRNLEVIGEVEDGMVLDPNKKYGVLIRSSPSYTVRSDSRRSGAWVYEREQDIREMVWRDGNTLRHQNVQVLDRELKFAADSYGPTGPIRYDGYTSNKSLAKPLLIDLTIVKALE